MHKARPSVVRTSEVAWLTMEPEQSRLEFDWLDSAIAQLANADTRSGRQPDQCRYPRRLVRVA
jgi:hypothetical protein